jgi:hypothetical protein
MYNRTLDSVAALAVIFILFFFCYLIALGLKMAFGKKPKANDQNASSNNNFPIQNYRSATDKNRSHVLNGLPAQYVKAAADKMRGYEIYDSITKCPYCSTEYPIMNCHINKTTFCKICNNFFVIKTED